MKSTKKHDPLENEDGLLVSKKNDAIFSMLGKQGHDSYHHPPNPPKTKKHTAELGGSLMKLCILDRILSANGCIQ